MVVLFKPPDWLPKRGHIAFSKVLALGSPFALERSAKGTKGKLSNDRFLLGFPKLALSAEPDDKLLRFCMDLGAPRAETERLLTLLPKADTIGIGYEPKGDEIRFKCYLEYPPDDGPEENLAYVALKWLAGNAKVPPSFTRYWSRRNYSGEKQRALIASILPPGAELNAAHKAFDLITEIGSTVDLLEVEEPGNPRHSIDVSLGGKGFTINDLKGSLPSIFDELIEKQGRSKLSRLAAGIGRDESPFVSIYYEFI